MTDLPVVDAADRPVFLGPVSEFIGRARVMHVAFLAFFRECPSSRRFSLAICTKPQLLTLSVFNFPVAFANNIAVHLIFRFLTGFGGSAFLSVSGGAISDVFPNAKVGT